jgi:hypothetical protein
MRRAMLGLIDKGEPQEARPAYWAPFVVVGQGAAITRYSVGIHSASRIGPTCWLEERLVDFRGDADRRFAERRSLIVRHRDGKRHLQVQLGFAHQVETKRRSLYHSALS